MEELKKAHAEETDPRKAQKLEKKMAKLAKFLGKTHITPAPKKEKKKLEFAEEAALPEGEKKHVLKLEGQFNPLGVESSWFSWWEKSGFFTPEHAGQKSRGQKGSGKKFVMVLPPPNVTGSLHIGHAMMAAIQDALVRFRRMEGYETLYLPGTDHAGIATQVVVEKSLAKKGQTRQMLGREEFLARVWEWKEAYGSEIVAQFKRLGSSLDFTRERFTMDAGCSKAVTEAFVRFYREGLIYRGNRLVNWCAKIQTSLSDLEVEYASVEPYQKICTDGKKYVFGRLFTVRYDLEKDGRVIGSVDVSTTRPETIFGDAALCAHPEDGRYAHLKGAHALNPLTGEKMQVIFDEAAEMSFGTGVLKVTPAHDPVDFALGEKHGLPMVSVIDAENRLTAGPFKGEPRFEAREHTVQMLREKSRLVREEGHAGSVPLCSRTGEVVEPRLMPQWWMKCSALAQQAMEKSETGELQIVPEEMKKTWNAWLGGIKDWCLSRQLWWGHRVPAYTANGKWYIAHTKEEAEKEAGCAVEQDEDVLDTWFSSGLWPFSTLGWPESTADMEKYYPTSLLETGKDIVFFWVARMVMMGLALTEKLPFKTVLFHSIVRDAKGEKMSKSKGNVIDPVDVISGTTLEKLLERVRNGNLSEAEVSKACRALAQEYPQGIEACGSDALRFSLLTNSSLGRDVNLSVDKVASSRRFCNKVWNAMKFVMAQCVESGRERSSFHKGVDAWIETRLSQTVRVVTDALEQHGFMKATNEAYQFMLYEFCDFYLELFKGRKDAEGVHTLRRVAVEYLRLMHPFLPFLTEEVYQAMKNNYEGESGESLVFAESICIDAYPVPGVEYAEESAEVEKVLVLIRDVRSELAQKPGMQEVHITHSKASQMVSLGRESIARMVSLKVFLTEQSGDSSTGDGISFVLQ
ncbi:valyl-tRNA synthetase [Nematocida sp. AWRm77]|nr:valyl-tRNA synthetase [Nematocida sp. AWRm77]